MAINKLYGRLINYTNISKVDTAIKQSDSAWLTAVHALYVAYTSATCM